MVRGGVLAGLALLALLAGLLTVRRGDSGPLLRTVPLGTTPVGVAVDARTGRIFVVDRNTDGDNMPRGPGTLSILDENGRSVQHAVHVGMDPRAAVLDTGGRRILVVNDDEASVSILDAHTNTLLRTTGVGPNPRAVALDTRTDRAFVVNTGNGTLSVLDARRGVVLRTVRVSDAYALSSVAVDERTSRVFLGSATSSGGALYVLDAGTGAVLRTATVGQAANRIGVDARSGHVFVLGDTELSMLDARSGRLLRTISAGVNPTALAVDTRRGRVYVTASGEADGAGAPKGPGSLSVLDAASGTLVRTLGVGIDPRTLAVNDRAGRVVVVNRGGVVPLPDAWGWIPEGLRRALPFLASGVHMRTVPASISILDMSKL